MVLRTRICRRDKPPLRRQALQGALQQQAMSRPVDAVHALLSLVPDQSAPAVEAGWQPTYLQSVQLGHRQGVLELLCLVQRAGAT